MGRFFVKGKITAGPQDWQQLLAEPEKHWKKGNSAKSLAYSWEDAAGFPQEVKKAFSASPYQQLREPDMLVAFPEYKVALTGGGGASQNDIFVLGESNGELLSVTVEGKVAEPFDLPISKWLKVISSPTGKSGKPKRLEYLLKKLGITNKDVGNIGYQLFHRTVSALIMAERFGALHAVMLVHSFSQSDEHLADYQAFARLFGINDADVNTVSYAGNRNGIDLYLAWVRGDKRFLEK